MCFRPPSTGAVLGSHPYPALSQRSLSLSDALTSVVSRHEAVIQDERLKASSARVERIQQAAGSRVPENQAAEREPCAEEMWAPEGAKSVEQYMKDSLGVHPTPNLGG